MGITVLRSKICGTVQVPASKSHTQRLLAGALLAPGNSVIRNPSRSDDALAAMRIISTLGARIEDNGDHLSIRGGFNPTGQKLDCGEAGLSLRMFSPIAALADQTMVLNGSGTLVKRPMHMISESLSQLGVRCQSQEGCVPIWIRGPIHSGKVLVDGSISSQLLTGILMALPVVKGNSVVEVKELQSKPYVDLTLEVLKGFGVQVDNEDYQRFNIRGKQKYRPGDFTVEGDWSGASFLLVAAALGGTATLGGLQMESSQADRQILTALGRAGAIIQYSGNEVTVSRNELKAFDFDATHCPDLFPPLVALAAHCEGMTRIQGVHRLIHKESNRARALQEEFSQIGVNIKTEGNQMYVTGPSLMKTGEVDSRGDHRIAMAAATTAIGSRTPVRIKSPECVAKSYPTFYSDLQTLGGRINE